MVVRRERSYVGAHSFGHVVPAPSRLVGLMESASEVLTHRAGAPSGPSVSILIPAYNAEPWIGDAIQSALAQTYAETEIIVLDDGSTDATLGIARGYAVRVETQPNARPNAARNRLLALCTGTWVRYLDADDRLLPAATATQLASLRPGLDVVVAPISVGGSTQMHTPNLDVWSALFEAGLGSTSSILWRRAALVRVGGWNEDVARGQEYELLYRLLQSGVAFGRGDRPAAEVRTTNTSSVSRSDPAASIVRHATLIRDALAHLECTDALAPERRATAASVLFRLARRVRRYSLVAARELFAAALHWRPELGVELRRSGPVYGCLLAAFEFDAAETYDGVARPLRRAVAARARFIVPGSSPPRVAIAGAAGVDAT